MVEVKSLFAKRSLLPHIAAADYIYKEDGAYKLKRETKWNLIPKDIVNNFHFRMESPLAGRVCAISQGIHVTISNITLA